MTNSNWKPIPSLQNQYEANEYGQIRSVRRKSTRGRIIKPYISPHNGYVYVVTSVNNEQKTQRVHKLVAEAFFGDANGRQINHKDGNKQNNAVENLEYCTQSENMKHAYNTGLEKPRGIKIINTETGTVFDSAESAAKSVGGKRGELVMRVCRGERSHYRNARFATLDDYNNGTIPEYKGKTARKASVSLWR